MQATAVYQTLADIVLFAHFSIVVFVVGGLVLIVVGNVVHWPWVNHIGFRGVHLAAIVFVVVESWVGVTCPLTALESWLRVQAGSQAYASTFVEHWIGSILFYDAPPWVFALAYTGFGLAVVLVWRTCPPRRGARRDEPRA